MIFDVANDVADAIHAMPAEHPRRKMLSLLDEAIHAWTRTTIGPDHCPRERSPKRERGGVS